jgi:hypothetical protein
MIWPHGVIIRLAFRTYYKMYTYHMSTILVFLLYVQFFVINTKIASWDCGLESQRGHGSLRCVLSCSLSDELINRPGESYRLWCVIVCNVETSSVRRPWPTGGCCAKNKRNGNKLLKILFRKWQMSAMAMGSWFCLIQCWVPCGVSP